MKAQIAKLYAKVPEKQGAFLRSMVHVGSIWREKLITAEEARVQKRRCLGVEIAKTKLNKSLKRLQKDCSEETIVKAEKHQCNAQKMMKVKRGTIVSGWIWGKEDNKADFWELIRQLGLPRVAWDTVLAKADLI